MRIYYKMFYTHSEAELWINKNSLVEKIVSITACQASLYSSLQISVWYKNEQEVL
jgi:hypothetical protein